MRLLNFFRRRDKQRDRIGYNTIHKGCVLKVYPASRSHVTKPYLVRVVSSTISAFTTELVHPDEHPNPRRHTFVYRGESWGYHRNRFQIIQK